MGGMTYSYVWRDSFLCEVSVIHMCDVTYFYVTISKVESKQVET